MTMFFKIHEHLCHSAKHYLFAAHFANANTSFKIDKSTFKSEGWQTAFLPELY